ncbi:MAG: hypothetical protein ABSF22_25045 [Bryobacteraceae bacterium]
MRNLSLTLFAVLAVGQLKADIVTFVDMGNGSGSISVPAFYNLTTALAAPQVCI